MPQLLRRVGGGVTDAILGRVGRRFVFQCREHPAHATAVTQLDAQAAGPIAVAPDGSAYATVNLVLRKFENPVAQRAPGRSRPTRRGSSSSPTTSRCGA